MKTKCSPLPIAAAATFLHLLPVTSGWADTVVDYHQGGTDAPLTNPYSSLGNPGSIVAEGTAFGAVYSPFNPHYEDGQLVQIGEGGDLTLRLDSVLNVAPGAPEIALFTNIGLIDGDYPNGLNNIGAFGVDPVHIDVSEDGLDWVEVGEVVCDFPGNAFTDAPAPFHPDGGGLSAADPSKPHGLGSSDIEGLTYSQILSALDGSAGGTWIDLDPSGLQSVAYVRLRVPDDGDPETQNTFELCSIVPNRDLDSGIAPTGVQFIESFEDDPIGTRATSDPDHASYADGGLNVSYDLASSPKRTYWPLGASLTDQDSFSFRVEFSIGSIAFDTSSFGQLSFGLINAATTGDLRTTSPSDAWDLVTIDYFPNPDFATFTPTVIGSQQDGDTDAFSRLGFPSGSASIINEPGEIGELPTGTRLVAELGYDATTRVLTLRLQDQIINSFGPDPDGDDTTIQYTMPGRITFEVDTFALLCWQDLSGGTAGLTFHHLSLTTPSPAANYYSWADANITAPIARGPHVDANADGLSNLLDYALGGAHPSASFDAAGVSLSWQEIVSRDDVSVSPNSSSDLRSWGEAPDSIIGAGPGSELHRSTIPLDGEQHYLRLQATRP